MKFPRNDFRVFGRTDDDSDEPTTAVQFSVLDRGKHMQYGDQAWVFHGDAIRDSHPDGRIRYRTVTVRYGEWTDLPRGDIFLQRDEELHERVDRLRAELATAALALEHRCELLSDFLGPGDVRAECSCGWVGVGRTLLADALADHADHVRTT